MRELIFRISRHVCMRGEYIHVLAYIIYYIYELHDFFSEQVYDTLTHQNIRWFWFWFWFSACVLVIWQKILWLIVIVIGNHFEIGHDLWFWFSNHLEWFCAITAVIISYYIDFILYRNLKKKAIKYYCEGLWVWAL